MMHLKIASFPPVNDITEEIAQLTKSEEQSVAEVGCQGSYIRNRNHLDE